MAETGVNNGHFHPVFRTIDICQSVKQVDRQKISETTGKMPEYAVHHSWVTLGDRNDLAL